MSKPTVLIICERWKAGHEERGLSLTETEVIGAIECTNLAEVAVCHYDADMWLIDGEVRKGASDLALVRHCLDRPPDLIYYVQIAHSDRNPDYVTLAFLRRTLDIPMIATWWDVERDDVQMIDRVFPFIDLNLIIDHFDVRPYTRSPERYLPIWTPTDSRLVCNPGKVRDIPVSFVGTLDGDGGRSDGISALRRAGVPLVLGSGQHADNWPREAYYDVLQRSKIVLNFSSAQLKGRTWEALLCGSLLMEPAQTPLHRYYTPGQEYVSYTDTLDLVEKVQYYLAHDAERAQIALNGHQTASTRYSTVEWFRLVCRQVGQRVPSFSWGVR